MHAPTASGLDDVVAAETVLSDVNGQLGQLVIRGHAVEELVETSTFEDIAALMWNGETPGGPERESLRASLAAARQDAFRMLPSLGEALDGPDAMEALRAGVAHLRATADQREDRLRLTAAIPVFSAAWHRAAVGQPAVAPGLAGFTHCSQQNECQRRSAGLHAFFEARASSSCFGFVRRHPM